MPAKHEQFQYRYDDYAKLTRNGSLLSESRTSSSFTSQVDSVGLNVPNWRQKIANGEAATGSLVASWSKVKCTPFSSVVRARPFPGSPNVDEETRSGFWGTAPALWDGFPSRRADADAQARARWVKQALDSQRKLQGGVILGELKETLSMIKNPVKAMEALTFDLLDNYRRIARKMRRQRPKNVGEANKRLRGSYLEWAYGWVPLMSDVDSAMEELVASKRRLSVETNYIRSIGDVRQRITDPPKTKSIGFTQYFQHERYWRVDRVKILAAMRREHPSPLTMVLNQLGFNPVEDFLPTVWELIPYSLSLIHI